MRRPCVPALCLAAALALCACLAPPGPAERARMAVHDLNVATRFGRMDIALERVAVGHRDDFVRRHARWGDGLRIVDVDIVGMSMRSKEEADVMVRVGWMRADETDLRSTLVVQKWRSQDGKWLLATEERRAGDVGALGETVEVVRPPQRPDAHYPSVVIR